MNEFRVSNNRYIGDAVMRNMRYMKSRKERFAMEVIRVTEEWQRAGVHYVRTEGMVKDFNLSLEGEFDTDTPDTPYILVRDGNLPVATCRIHYLPDEQYAKIERVCTIPQYRGKGAGRLAIEEAERWIYENGYRKIVITSRDEAVGFYQALGYEADLEHVETGGVFPIIYTEKHL